MRLIILILMFFTTHQVYSQNKLVGEWQEHPNNALFNEIYTFSDNGRFSYSYIGDILDSTYGEGSYDLQKGMLSLVFDEVERKENQYEERIVVLDTIYSMNEVIYRVILLNAKDKQPVAGATAKVIFLLDSLVEKKFYFESDNNGEMEIKIPKGFHPPLIEISYVDCEIFRFIPEDEVSLSLKIKLKPKNWTTIYYVPSGQLWLYNIEIDEVNDLLYIRKNSLYKWSVYQKNYNDK